jgi:hypothetical protein
MKQTEQFNSESEARRRMRELASQGYIAVVQEVNGEFSVHFERAQTTNIWASGESR